MATNHWVISVSGYGAFLFEGDERAAEEMRSHKARWERGIGRKRPADPEEVKTGSVRECLNHHGYGGPVYVDCSCPDVACVVSAQERTYASDAFKRGSK